MKTIVRLLLACGVLLTMGGCAHNNENPGPIAGGLTDASVHDNDVKAAARYAVGFMAQETKANLVLVAILKAKRQVVAGTNYHLTLQVSGVEGGRSRVAKAIVWKKLDGMHELTRWTWE